MRVRECVGAQLLEVTETRRGVEASGTVTVVCFLLMQGLNTYNLPTGGGGGPCFQWVVPPGERYSS